MNLLKIPIDTCSCIYTFICTFYIYTYGKTCCFAMRRILTTCVSGLMITAMPPLGFCLCERRTCMYWLIFLKEIPLFNTNFKKAPAPFIGRKFAL